MLDPTACLQLIIGCKDVFVKVEVVRAVFHHVEIDAETLGTNNTLYHKAYTEDQQDRDGGKQVVNSIDQRSELDVDVVRGFDHERNGPWKRGVDGKESSLEHIFIDLELVLA